MHNEGDHKRMTDLISEIKKFIEDLIRPFFEKGTVTKKDPDKKYYKIRVCETSKTKGYIISKTGCMTTGGTMTYKEALVKRGTWKSLGYTAEFIK